MRSHSRSKLARLAISAVVLVVALVAFASKAKADRLRDLTDVIGARENQLVGYGIVTGLNGTGDDASAPFAAQSLRSLLRRLGVQIDARQVRLKNVAAVLVTANVPAFSRTGGQLDVIVSSMGNAKSLQGGVLIQTPLRGADRRTYAVAQGALLLGGFSAGGAAGGGVQQNSTTTARVPSGALVEREIQTSLTNQGTLTLALRRPDFATAQRIAEAVDTGIGAGTARALDGGAVSVKIPREFGGKLVELISKIGELDVNPSQMARVVINERTGTIVVGGDVRLSPVAIAQGGITITVKETAEVSQPGILAKGETKVTQRSDVEVAEAPPPALTYLDGAASLADVARALSTFGVTPRDLASILQALRAAGALRAEIIVQ